MARPVRALITALSPSIDAEWRLADVVWEEKNNVRSERRWAGGKGINVARWLQHLGGKPRLLLPLGGGTGRELARYLRQEKLAAVPHPLTGATRVNIIVTTDAGRQMRFNAAGPLLTTGDWRVLQREVSRRVRDVDLLVLSGSLPRGLPDDAYASLLELARRHGVRAVLDCEGPALRAAVKARPFLVKPNQHELAAWWRQPLRTEAETRRAAHAMSRQTRGWVLVSRGRQRGLLLNAMERVALAAAPPAVTPRNTVGAGDALVAAVALAVAQGAPPEQWLEAGLAVGSAATECLPGELPVDSRLA